MRVKKAIIPAAGMGTRVLPASKSMPKEMLPIVDRPAIQYIVEEAVNSGIRDIMIVISRGKNVVQDHFDRSPELEQLLLSKGMKDKYEEILKISQLANIVFIRQKQAKGLGDAILCAESFIGDEPFAVLYGDDVIKSEVPVCKQLCDVYSRFNCGVLGIQKLDSVQIQKCSSMKLELIEDNIFRINDMVEKPKLDQILSNYSILGRCVLLPEIFSILRNIDYGSGGELQLTDAMRVLACRGEMVGVDYLGTRYDMGSKFGIMKANVEFALENSELCDEFRQYIIDLCKDRFKL